METRGRGRPKKQPISYDAEAVKEFTKRFFEIEREKKVLQEDKIELKEEFKNKIDHKLLGKVIRLVKAKVALEEEDTSDNTLEEIEKIVRDKVNMVI